MRGALVLLALTLPAIAGAEVSSQGAAVLELCQIPGLTLDERIAAAQAAGLAPATPDSAPAAALALAPHDLVLVRMFGLMGRPWDVARATEQARTLAATAERRMMIPGTDTAVLTGAGGLVLGLTQYAGSPAACAIALPGLTPEDLSAATGQTLEDSSALPIRLFSTMDGQGVDPTFLGFTPFAFDGFEPAPIVSIYLFPEG